MNDFPQFNPLRNVLRIATSFSLLAVAVTFYMWMKPDMGAVAAFSLPAVVIAVLVFLRWGPANLIAGIFALGWFAYGVMMLYAEHDHWIAALIVTVLSIDIVLAVSWVGLQVRKAKRNL